MEKRCHEDFDPVEAARMLATVVTAMRSDRALPVCRSCVGSRASQPQSALVSER